MREVAKDDMIEKMSFSQVIRKTLRIIGLSIVGIIVLGLLITLCFSTRRNSGIDTSVKRRELRFYKDGSEWYADVPQHRQAENRMVAGADLVLDAVSDGADEVVAVISSDVEEPGDWKLHFHLVEHDAYGATYLVKREKGLVTGPAWLCNVTHTVFGGEHPSDIYVHSIKTR